MSQRLPFWQSPLSKEKNDSEEPQLETHDETLFENFQFKHYEQTSNIQLFFDLFFVANLTTFTRKHEINSTDKLSSYIGFFAVLWLTWCQVTLYDVRFATDSIFERFAHLCHFGVMVGLATVGPQFDPNHTYWDSLQQLSLMLMASRIVLFFQYGSTVYFTWKYRHSRTPLALVMLSLFVAAAIYLGLSFAFSLETAPNAYLAWYVVALCEVIANIAISGKWSVLSLADTHLVERMSCLTLIVLGEGVIGLTGRIATIESNDFVFTAGTIGSIISALLIIYLVYQLYFDNIPEGQFGNVRQQVWAFLHFPFHMALVLLMEGTNQFLTWRHLVEIVESISNYLASVDTSTQEGIYVALNTTIWSVWNTFPSPDNSSLTEALDALQIFAPGSSPTTEEAILGEQTVILTSLKLIFKGYQFEPPSEVAGATPIETYNAYYAVFELVFGYFFICAGIVLIGLGILALLSMHRDGRHTNWRRYVGIVTNILFGTGLALMSTMVLTSGVSNLGESAWTLPLLVFVLMIALLLNHIPQRLVNEIAKAD